MVGRHVHFERLRLFRLFGRRGLVLIMFGAIWVIFGVQSYLAPVQRFRDDGSRGVPIVDLLDHPAANLLWLATGLISIVSGAIRVRHGGRDALGFNALLLMPLLYVLAFFWSGLAWLITSGAYGRSTAASAFIVWAVVCAFLLLCAGWSDADDPAHWRSGDGR